MNQLSQQQLHGHVQVLAWLRIIGAAFLAVIGIGLLLLLSSIGLASREAEPFAVLAAVGLFIAGLMIVLALPSFLAGVGLLRGKNWGRILALIVGFFDLVNFPIGTAIAAYSFYVLLQESATSYFGIISTSRPAAA